MRLTNWSEVAAVVLARTIVIAVMFVAGPLIFSPFYIALYRQGGATLLMIGALSIGFVAWCVTLLLFLAFRAGFGAVPPIVAPPERKSAFTSTGGEIGAFALSVLIVTGLMIGVNTWLLPGLYASLRTGGHAGAVQAVALAVSFAALVVFFLLFIAFRSACSDGAPHADRF